METTTKTRQTNEDRTRMTLSASEKYKWVHDAYRQKAKHENKPLTSVCWEGMEMAARIWGIVDWVPQHHDAPCRHHNIGTTHTYNYEKKRLHQQNQGEDERPNNQAKEIYKRWCCDRWRCLLLLWWTQTQWAITMKRKRYKDLMKDLVFNNPRADRQAGKPDGWSKEVLDNQMLYDDTPHIKRIETLTYNAPKST